MKRTEGAGNFWEKTNKTGIDWTLLSVPDVDFSIK
jgi:hypothetical protein